MNDFTRREVIHLTLGQFLGLAVALPSIVKQSIAADAFQGTVTNKGVNWQFFLDRIANEARAQFAPGWDQPEYVRRVSQAVKQLDLSDADLARALKHYTRVHSARPEFAQLHRTAAFEVTLITFHSGEKITHHNHPDMTGVLACTSGSLRVDEYDLINRVSQRAVFLRHVGTKTLLPGHVSALTAADRNIHSVRALSFSQVFDIFTPPYDRDRMSRTHWYYVSTESEAGDRRLFRAAVQNR